MQKNINKPFSDHVYIDRRSRDFHALIAERIRNNPKLLVIAYTNIVRWRNRHKTQNPNRPEPYYLAAWEEILDKGLEYTLAFMCEDSEKATQLRQSSPFAGIIAQRERIEFFKTWNATNWNT